MPRRMPSGQGGEPFPALRVRLKVPRARYRSAARSASSGGPATRRPSAGHGARRSGGHWRRPAANEPARSRTRARVAPERGPRRGSPHDQRPRPGRPKHPVRRSSATFVNELADRQPREVMGRPERAQRGRASWTEIISLGRGDVRIATGTPRFVIVIVSPASTALSSRGRWVLASYEPTVRTVPAPGLVFQTSLDCPPRRVERSADNGRSGVASSARSGPGMARVDHEHASDLRAEAFDVVRDRRIPGHVVAGPRLDHMVTLGHPPTAGDDDVVLVAGVGVDTGRSPRRDRSLEDPNVARSSAIDLFHRRAVRTGSPRAIRRANDTWCRRGIEEQPRNRDFEGSRNRGQSIERGHGLAVLDLGQISDVEAASVADLGQRQASGLTPATHLAPDVGPLRTWTLVGRGFFFSHTT